MTSFKYLASALISSLLVACGGGGGGGDGGGGGSGGSSTSISASTATLRFDGYWNGGPAPAVQTLTVTFKGAGVVVGTRPGETLAGWLDTPTVQSSSATQVVFNIQPFVNVGPGTYTQYLRFVTGTASQTDLKFVDVAITLQVGAISVPTVSGNLGFLEIDGDPDGAQTTSTATIHIVGDTGWQATSSQPWVTFDAATGTQGRDVTVQVDRGALALGTHDAQVTITEAVTGNASTFPVSYLIRSAQLATSANSLAFNLDSQTQPSGLARTFTVTDELGGAIPAKAVSWTASVDNSWLELSAASGSSAPGLSMVAQLTARDADLIGSGSYTANIVFDYVDASGGTGTLQIPVTLQVRLPTARAVTPYFIPPNVPAMVRVRGEDIRVEDMSGLTLQGVPGAVFTRIDATHVGLALPALPIGSYDVRVANSAGISRSAATVIVGNAPAIGAGVIESPNVKRLVFDEQRGRILAIDRTQFQIETYTWNGSAWVAGVVLSVPEVADAALARSGKDLIIVARNAIYVADASDLSAPRRTVWTRPPDPYYTPAFNAISINDQGAALITQTYHFAAISGGTPLVYFDALRQVLGDSPTGFAFHYESQLSRSPGGRYTVTSGWGTSPPEPTLVFDSYTAGTTLLGGLVEMNTFSYYQTRDIDYAGTRMLEGSYGVRDMQGALLGTLGAYPGNTPYVYAVLSPDGTRAFKLVESTPGNGSIDVQDLAGVPAPDYPVIGSLPMPARVADPAEYPYLYPGATYYLSGQVTRDGNFLILAGPERMAIVDISAF